MNKSIIDMGRRAGHKQRLARAFRAISRRPPGNSTRTVSASSPCWIPTATAAQAPLPQAGFPRAAFVDAQTDMRPTDHLHKADIGALRKTLMAFHHRAESFHRCRIHIINFG